MTIILTAIGVGVLLAGISFLMRCRQRERMSPRTIRRDPALEPWRSADPDMQDGDPLR